MGSEENQDLYLELLRAQDKKVDDMFQEIQILRSGFQKVLELNCQLAQATADVHTLKDELELVKNSVAENAKDLIIPKFLEKGFFWLVGAVVVALLTLWVSKTDVASEPPTPVINKSEIDVKKMKLNLRRAYV